jgi:hypothetical protein
LLRAGLSLALGWTVDFPWGNIAAVKKAAAIIRPIEPSFRGSGLPRGYFFSVTPP